MADPDTKFSVMVSLFNWVQKSKSSSIKRSKFRKFLDTFCRPGNGDDYFSAIRLILPILDRERGSYGLREHVMATCLIDALGMSRDSPDSQRLLKWRKGGPKSGAFAGNFSLIAAEVLQRRQGMASGGLTIKQLNDLLDLLASSENRSDKTSVLSELIRKTNAQEMKWIIMIILKDLKLGISEKSIFHEFHPDAEDLFNVTCDLKLVCEKLRDRRQRHKRQDIEVGKPVRPQLALRVGNVAAAWKKLHGKDVVVECKFDGDRIQIHRNGADVKFFSRNFLDHPEYEHGILDIIRENILIDRCILDGEMLVWDTSSNRFAEFGSNQEIAKAAKEGLDSDRQLCYVAFDVLYVGDTSVIHQSLKERHQLLRKVVKPVAGRLEILVPDGGLNAHQAAGEPCRSLIAHDAETVERFFKETVENRDEGLVLKDLNSKWEPGDRSGKWLKLKPEYVRAGSDLDVLIIGGYYGSGRRGGEVAQFLVGLAESPALNTYPRRFVSFCRVGTGLSDEELMAVVTKLKPYLRLARPKSHVQLLRNNEYPKKPSPSFYQVTNNSKERPDVWVESPEKSLILSITSDIRTIRSEVFAAPYSLRFPRIDQVRYDKPWYECLNVQSFIELVHSSNGTTQRAANTAIPREDEPQHVNLSKGVKRKNVSVPFHFIQTDVSQVKGETSIFSNMTFYFVNVPSSHSLDSLHKMVVENGGTFSMNLNNSVTHCITSESKGIKFQAAKRQGDVISFSWFSESCSQKKQLPLHPKYFLHLSDTSKKKLEEEIDEYSDSYYLDLNLVDLKQILGNIGEVGDFKERKFYMKKLCPKDKWIRFHGCHIYLYLPRQYLKNKSWEVPLEFAMRRMKNEICMSGGSVAETLFHTTHLVVISAPQTDIDFNSLLSSFLEPDRLLLHRKGLQIVGSQWLEDSFEKDQKLPEHNYSLKPLGFESLTGDSYEHEAATEQCHVLARELKDGSSPEKEGKALSVKQRIISLPKRQMTRKGGISSRTYEIKGKQVVNQSWRKRSRVRHTPAKIQGHDFDSDGSSDSKEEFESTSSISRSGMLKNKGRSGLSQPRRKRTQIRSKPANIGGDQLDKDTFSEEQTMIQDSEDTEGNCKASKMATFPITELQGKGEVKDSPARKGKEAEPSLFPGNCGPSQGVHKVDELGCGKGISTQYEDRIGAPMDPVQAMLLNMVPVLGEKRVQSAIPAPSQVHEADPVDEWTKRSLDAEMPPGKKKKVSYKDVANELLKDW